MTVRDQRIPETISTAVVIAGIAGVLSLGIHDPIAVSGMFVGLGLVVGTARLTGSYWRVWLATGLCAGIAGIGVGLIGLRLARVGTTAGILAAVTTVIGIGLGLLAIAGRTERTIERGGVAAMYGSLAAFGWATGLLAVEAVGGVGAALSGLVWIGGTGSLGLRVSLVLAAVAVGAAVFALPPAAITRPENIGTYRTVRRGFVVGLGIVTVVLAGAISVGRYIQVIETVVDPLAGSAVVRVPLAVTIAAGTGLAVFAAVVRELWMRASEPYNAAVPMLSGALVGIGGFVLVAFGLGTGIEDVIVVLFGTAVVLGVGGSFTWASGIELAHDGTGATLTAGATQTVSFALAVGAIVTGAGVELQAGLGVSSVLDGVSALALFAMAAFVTDVGHYGRILGWEIGRDGASPLPQFVRVGWSVAVAAAGFGIGVLGFVVATLFAPVLSAPAMLAVVLALGAILLGSWLLFA